MGSKSNTQLWHTALFVFFVFLYFRKTVLPWKRTRAMTMIKRDNRPYSLVHFVFQIQIMWWFSGDLVLCIVMYKRVRSVNKTINPASATPHWMHSKVVPVTRPFAVFLPSFSRWTQALFLPVILLIKCLLRNNRSHVENTIERRCSASRFPTRVIQMTLRTNFKKSIPRHNFSNSLFPIKIIRRLVQL